MNSLMTINEIKSNNLLAIADIREEKILLPEVVNGLNQIEQSVAKAAVKTLDQSGAVKINSRPIASLADHELIFEVKETLKWIVRNIGIKNWTGIDADFDGTQFTKFLRSYHPDLTYKEVELSFELLMARTLDPYLPLDSKGQPDRNHYQSFSMDFYGKVLTAYKSYKNKVWCKVDSLVPEDQKEATEDQKTEFRSTVINNIYEAFEAYKKDNIAPDFMLPFIVVNEFVKSGLIDEYPDIKPEDKQKALLAYLDNKMNSKYDKDKFKQEYQENELGERFSGYASIQAMRRKIIEVFEDLISQKKEISDFVTV